MIVAVAVFVVPLSSFTVAVNVAVPAVVGVPVIAPVAFTASPAAPAPDSAYVVVIPVAFDGVTVTVACPV